MAEDTELNFQNDPFFAENPDLLESFVQDIGNRNKRLESLKGRSEFIEKQLTMLNRQVDIYLKLSGGDASALPSTLVNSINLLTQEQLKVNAEYTQEFTNENPILNQPDSTDTIIQVDGKDIGVDTNLLEAVRKGDPEAINQVNELLLSDNPQDIQEGKAISQSVGEGMFETMQTSFLNNGEIRIAPTPIPQPTPQIGSLPQQPQTVAREVAQSNQNILRNIASTISQRRVGDIASTIAKLKGTLGASSRKITESTQ